MPDAAGTKRGWNASIAADFLLATGLAAALIFPLFGIEYLNHWESIESLFVSDARFLAAHWPHPGWQPDWYLGTRFDYIYPPLLRYGTAGLSLLSGWSAARAYHFFTALMYSLGIGAVYLLVRLGSGSRGWAWVTALATATLSPLFLFDTAVREDYAGFKMMPLRFGILLRYGEGPHSTTLALLPLAIAAAWFGLRRGRPGAMALAAVACGMVALTNLYGATALVVFFPIVVWCVWLAERDVFVWVRAGIITVLAYGLSAFWLTPSYLKITLANLRLVADPGNAYSAWAAVLVTALVAAVSWRLGWGRPERAWGVFVCSALALFALQVLGYRYFNFRLLGNADRFAPEFDMLFLMAATLVLSLLWRKGLAGKAVAGAVMAASLYPVWGWLRHPWQFIEPDQDYKARIECRLTDWMRRNMPDARAVTTGSVRFWYTAWSDLPELGGAAEQGLINFNSVVGQYQIVGPTSAGYATLFAQALGIGALIVHDERSQEAYHNWGDPERFQGLLETLYDDGAGNWIYRVPRRYPQRVRIVRLNDIQALGRFSEPVEVDRLERYVAALEQGPDREAAYVRPEPDQIRLRAELAAGQGLLVQETWDPAWTAAVDGKPAPVGRDYMDFMLIRPGPGTHEVVLTFETPFENRVGRGMTLFSLAAAAMLGVAGIRRRRRRGPG